MNKQNFGSTKNGEQVFLFTISSKNGLTAKITNYGATWVSLEVPDANGDIRDVLQGFADVSGYENSPYYMGATIGRHAGQIRRAGFELNGKEYKTVVNDLDNTMHGGPEGFHSRIFKVEKHSEDTLVFSYLSKDGEAGFPGNLDVTVTYYFNDDNELCIDFDARCDQDTVLSMTNHAYFNLNGHDSDTMLDNQLKIYADNFMEVDEQLIPTGKILPVAGTPLDFTEFYEIGARINDPFEQLTICSGYDHNWEIASEFDGKMRLCCELKAKDGLVHMQIFTNKPGLQMYSGNYLAGEFEGKSGVFYNHRSALCLEPQLCPDSLSHSNFPSAILRAGDEYRYRSKYKFIAGK